MAATPGHASDSAVRDGGSGTIEDAHSPGPWSAIEEDGKWLVVCDAYEDETPGICGNHSPEWPLHEGDATAIAALPDLIRALREMVRVADEQGARWRAKLPDGNSPLGLAYAALAKAGAAPAPTPNAHGTETCADEVGKPA